MKKILLIVLSFLILITGNVNVIALDPPISERFWHVNELLDWIETAESCCCTHRVFESFLNTARQQDSIITVNSVSDEFILSSIIAWPHNNNETIIYYFENEQNDRIEVFIYLAEVGETNQPLGEVVETLTAGWQRLVENSIQTKRLDSLYYVSFVEEIQGTRISFEERLLDSTNLYYITRPYGPIVFFEIYGTLIRIDFSIRNPDSPLALLRYGWDNSYLDMFQFISRPINMGGGVSPDRIRVMLNGFFAPIQFDVAPIITNNRVLVPIQFIAEALGVDVDWNEETREVTLAIDDESLIFAIGETVEGMDVPAQIINDRTFVPLRFVAEATGADVEWDEDARTVIITN